MAKNQGAWLTGRLTKDAQTRGKVVAFTVAVERDRRNQDDEKKTDYPNVVTFGKTADKCRDLRKGDAVFVIGTIQTGSYENKDGKKVYTTDVIADQVFIDGGAKKAAKPQDDDNLFGGDEQDDFMPLDETDGLPFK